MRRSSWRSTPSSTCRWTSSWRCTRPAPGEPPKYALYFTRADFEKQLSEPLADTLANRPALLPGGMPATDVKSVRALVQPRVFGYRYSLQLDGTAQIVLTQPGTTEATIAPTAGG